VRLVNTDEAKPLHPGGRSDQFAQAPQGGGGCEAGREDRH